MNIFKELERGLEIPDPQAMENLGEIVGQQLPENGCLALSGSLGVGKTTFTRGLAHAFAIPGPLHSPTYTYYTLHYGRRQLLHLDAYRIDRPETLDALMLDEFLQEPYTIVVEWPENIKDWLPPETLWLHFTIERHSLHKVRKFCNFTLRKP